MLCVNLISILMIMVMTTLSHGSTPLAAVPPSQCMNTPSSVKFSVTSHRNETGHWLGQVRLDHGDEDGKTGVPKGESGFWNVDLEQTTTQCAGGHAIQIVATLTGPVGSVPGSVGSVPPGYELFPGVGSYKLHTTTKTWDEARKICIQEGSYLAVINSEAEAQALKTLFDRVPNFENTSHNKFVFIGIHDRYVEGEYLTIFGNSLESTGFTRWATGEPNNSHGNENCGSFDRLTSGLNDAPCQWKLGFICEHAAY